MKKTFPKVIETKAEIEPTEHVVYSKPPIKKEREPVEEDSISDIKYTTDIKASKYSTTPEPVEPVRNESQSGSPVLLPSSSGIPKKIVTNPSTAKFKPVIANPSDNLPKLQPALPQPGKRLIVMPSGTTSPRGSFQPTFEKPGKNEKEILQKSEKEAEQEMKVSIIEKNMPKLGSLNINEEDFGQEDDVKKSPASKKLPLGLPDNKGLLKQNDYEQMKKQQAEERIKNADIREDAHDDTESIEFDWKLEASNKKKDTQFDSSKPKIKSNFGDQKKPAPLGLMPKIAKNEESKKADKKAKDSDSENSWD